MTDQGGRDRGWIGLLALKVQLSTNAAPPTLVQALSGHRLLCSKFLDGCHQVQETPSGPARKNNLLPRRGVGPLSTNQQVFNGLEDPWETKGQQRDTEQCLDEVGHNGSPPHLVPPLP